jgi:2-polyprenyl-6-methoxyphenol hydroxylase-like FAD-dependent oxidoreductase
MADVVVCGGGVIGLSAAMMLARDGHDVTVLERDREDVPDSVDEAWERWPRHGVPQFRQPHNLFPRYRQILEAELPDVLSGLEQAGGTWIDFMANLPPSIPDQTHRPEDDRFRFITGRRPMVEYVHARAAAEEPRVSVRRGTSAERLLTRSSNGDRPHVTGVVTADGELRADLVVDAMGRRSPVAGWLEAMGARPPAINSQDSGFTYYTRYFTGPQLPVMFGPPACPIGSFTILTLPGDNSTWSVTLFAPSGDPALKEFRDPEKFTKVVKACPLQAHWLDGTPITDVPPMAGILDRYRRFVLDGAPVVIGLAAVGDAWACTNPSAGRGLSVGLIHAQRLRDVVRSSLDDPDAFALEWDAVTEAEVAPWYWNQLAADQARLASMNAAREGGRASGEAGVPLPPEYEAAGRAMLQDAEVFRGVIESITCLALPQEVFSRPGMWERVEAAAGEATVFPGPSRQELLALLA